MDERESSDAESAAILNYDQIRELMELVHSRGLEEFEYRHEGFRLRIVGQRQHAPAAAAPAPQYTAPSPPPVPPTAGPRAEAPATPPPPADDDRYKKITAPMIGTFYRSSSPTAPSFVEVGDRIEKDTVLCIIEAMKLMNEIKAETRGVVRRIVVENGQTVEYGQPMFLIEPT